MTNSHTALAIAQVIFYLPMVPTAIFIFIRNWSQRPRLSWYPLIPFSLLRLAGGILTIVLESNPNNIGIIIATTIMLNVGLIPLIIAAVGLVRLVLQSSADQNKRAYAVLKFIRIAFIAAVGLLIAGGALLGSEKTLSLARALAQAGYVIFAILLALITLELIHLYGQRARLSPDSFIYVQLTLAAMPTLAVRAAYGLLYEFTSSDLRATWNPLYGSALAFALMGLLTEYITALFYVFLGFYRMQHPAHRTSQKVTSANDVV